MQQEVTLNSSKARKRDYSIEWQRTRAKAKERRAALIAVMGSKCKDCDETQPHMMTFHHPHGRLWEPNAVNAYTRIAKYEQDFAEGNLILLCGRCNTIDGNKYRNTRRAQVASRTKRLQRRR